MKLYLMRHAPAEDHAVSGRDFDRALTPEGAARGRSVAELLVREDEAPRRILSSPYVRALQTAELVARAVGPHLRVETCPELGAGRDAVSLVELLVAGDGSRVMLVGHEPDMGDLCSHLVPSWTGGFEKAMVVGVRIRPGEPSRVRFTLDPKRLHVSRA